MTTRWRRLSRPLLSLAAAAAIFASTELAGATVVERIVAVIGEHAILLSDLRARARPFLLRIASQPLDDAQRAAATTQVYSQMLARMVDEELEERAANQSHVSITPREIDNALARVAAQNNVSEEKVVAEAMASGLTEVQYRQEIRRQLLEAKLMNLRVQGRLNVTEADLESEYQAIVRDERKQLPFRPALIRIHAPANLPPAELERRRQLAKGIARQARRGADFGRLARQHSADPSREMGGLLGAVTPGRLPPALDTAALSLDVGEVSNPIRDGDSLVVLKIVERQPSSLPPFDEARNELGQRVYMTKMDAARRHWLDTLRRRFHVDIRL
jgi:peptidyl-prolyl cis-trans isomerase SurA